MLLAEIHGKHFSEIENNEDFLTSAVFGHLRSLPAGIFWSNLFSRAYTVHRSDGSLNDRLQEECVDLTGYPQPEMVFWKFIKDIGEPDVKYGEPDLLLHFHSSNQPPVVILIEIKLNSGKSGTDEDDQLAKYLRILDRSGTLLNWPSLHTYLVYLTISEGDASLLASARSYGDETSAQRRLFTLHWTDVLEAAELEQSASFLLREVAEFLRGRNLAPFAGFHNEALTLPPSLGCFYNEMYFHPHQLDIPTHLGAFYG